MPYQGRCCVDNAPRRPGACGGRVDDGVIAEGATRCRPSRMRYHGPHSLIRVGEFDGLLRLSREATRGPPRGREKREEVAVADHAAPRYVSFFCHELLHVCASRDGGGGDVVPGGSAARVAGVLSHQPHGCPLTRVPVVSVAQMVSFLFVSFPSFRPPTL